MTSTPGPAVDLIEYAAQIIVAKMREPGTAPYHWAGALWEAGMLVSPGPPTPTGPETCEHGATGAHDFWRNDLHRNDRRHYPCPGPATPEPTEETP